MRRREFLERTGLVAATTWVSPLWQAALAAAPAEPIREATDVLIVGGGLGGCAAALAAARRGARVVLSEPTDWLGGQLTSQAVPPDEHPWIERFGCTRSYRQLRDAIRDHYRQHYRLSAEARAEPYLNPGGGSVSKLCCEPRAALAALSELLAPHVASGRIRVLIEHEPVGADLQGDRVRGVRLRQRGSGSEVVVTAPLVLDATEEGDLLPLAKAEYVTGFESQNETQEPHAPFEAQPANLQSATWCFAVEHRPGEDHSIQRPADYGFWRDYLPQLDPPWPGKLLSWSMSHPITLKPREVMFDPGGGTRPGVLNLWLYRRIVAGKNFEDASAGGDVTLVNWPQNDYWLGNLHEVDPHSAERHRQQARQLSLSLLHWLQTEAPRDDGGTGWPGLRPRGDLLGTADGLAKAIYVRESRRIKAEFTVLELHVGTEGRMAVTGATRDEVKAYPMPDTVGIGSYRIDLHPSTGGNNYIDISSLPFQIPLGALLPVRVENLLPACKNLGVTHLTNGCYRLHPVEWNIGEAAGALAAYCLAGKHQPRQVRADARLLADFQASLEREGVELAWPAEATAR